MEFVDITAAREHSGLVLVVSALLPSLWSEAAKGIAHVKGPERRDRLWQTA